MFAPSTVSFRRIHRLLIEDVNILKQKGVKSLPTVLRDIFSKARRSLISLEKYYLYEKRLHEEKEIPCIQPRVEGVIMETIFIPISIEEYEALGERGFDFRKHPEARPYRSNEGKGTILFLGVKSNNIIYRSCISNYRNGIYFYIYQDYADSTTICYQGFNWTHPNFRKLGLYTWAQTEMFTFMKNQGYEKIVMLEPDDQVGPRKIQDRLGSTMICESFAFRCLFVIHYRWNKYRQSEVGYQA